MQLVLEHLHHYELGDVNGDGFVNIMDLTRLSDYLLDDGNVEIVEEASDFDGNGEINIMDVTRFVDMLLSV